MFAVRLSAVLAAFSLALLIVQPATADAGANMVTPSDNASTSAVAVSFEPDAEAEAGESGAQAAEEAPARWTPEPGIEIRFNVLRKGNPFGTHIVRFGEDERGRLTATTDVDLKAGLGPITLFRYTLDATETYSEDGTLIALDGQVYDDGNRGRVSASRVENGLEVEGTQFSGTVDLGILPSSHWNVDQTRQTELLSTEDGEILQVDVRELGRETLQINGTPVEATHYLMDSEIDVELWYDDTGRWVQLAFEARGQDILYTLDALYD